MRKTLLFFVAMLSNVMVFAQTITDASQLTDTTIVTLTTDRGTLTMSTDSMAMSDQFTTFTAMSDATANQFIFKTENGETALYHVLTGKYLTPATYTYNSTTFNGLSVTDDFSAATKWTLDPQGDGTFLLHDGDNTFNFGGSCQVTIDSWATADEGNKFTIVKVGVLGEAGETEEDQTIPAEGKTYVINRFNTSEAYIYESGSGLCTSALDNTHKQYWQFIPTGNENCYYIQNVTSKRYIQSTNLSLSQQVSVGSTPVEFEVKQNNESGTTAGYYYLCSTDQDEISVASDVTKGLNYSSSYSQVVAYWIKTGRGNSYWELTETEYDYVEPSSVEIERTDLAKRLGIYYIPCGAKSSMWLSSLSITGDEESVTNPLNYTASAQPTYYYNPVRSDSAAVVAGKTFTLSYTAQGIDGAQTLIAYFDWDMDGKFEESKEFESSASGTAEITVPEGTQTGKARMRFRISDSELNGPDDEVSGQAYDFMIYVSESGKSTGIENATVNPEKRTTAAAYNLEGKQVKLDTHKGVYIQSGKKRIK